MDYIKLVGGAEEEIIEKKSRFIAQIAPVETEEEAYAFIEKIRKKHYDARHNCFAFSVGTQMPLLRFSDDGEPQGTAGKPMLELIQNSGIHDICVVVTRYFGGTLLGTGGLVRAYTQATASGFDSDELYGYGKDTIYPEYKTGHNYQHGIRRRCDVHCAYSGCGCESSLKRNNRCNKCESAHRRTGRDLWMISSCFVKYYRIYSRKKKTIAINKKSGMIFASVWLFFTRSDRMHVKRNAPALITITGTSVSVP